MNSSQIIEAPQSSVAVPELATTEMPPAPATNPTKVPSLFVPVVVYSRSATPADVVEMESAVADRLSKTDELKGTPRAVTRWLKLNSGLFEKPGPVLLKKATGSIIQSGNGPVFIVCLAHWPKEDEGELCHQAMLQAFRLMTTLREQQPKRIVECLMVQQGDAPSGRCLTMTEVENVLKRHRLL